MMWIVRIPCILLFLPLVSSFAPLQKNHRHQYQGDRNDGIGFSRTRTVTSLSPEDGAVVTLECRLKPEGDFVPEPLFNGIVFDDEDPTETITFVLGEGNYLPGLHGLVSSMQVGESVENVSMDAGWGSWNPSLKATISMESLQNSGLDVSQIKVGVELMMANGLIAVVTEVGDEEFVVDANPPLAGASYSVNAKLLACEAGPSDFDYKPTETSDEKYQVATFALGKFSKIFDGGWQ